MVATLDTARGTCPLDESVCVTLAAETGPLETQLVGPFGGNCTSEAALCVSLPADAPPVDVNIVGANLTLAADSLHVHVVQPIGQQLSNTSVSVTLASDQPPVKVALQDVQTDTFARLRVSEANTIFDSKMLTNITDVLYFDNQEVSGTGTDSQWVEEWAAIVLSVSNQTAGRRVRQTLRYFNYQPGKSQLILMALVPGDSPAGITKRWGYYDDYNGNFYEWTDGRLYAVIRSSVSGSPVDTRVDVTDNLPLEWSPHIDVIYALDFAWMGVGQTVFSLFNATNSVRLYQDAGGMPHVASSNPNHPIRYEIINDGTGPAESMECISVSVMSEGGGAAVGLPTSVDRGNSRLALTTDGLVHSSIAVRLNPNGFLHATSQLLDVALSSVTGNVVYQYALRYRPTVAGTPLVWQNAPFSPLQYAIPDATNTVTGGYVLSTGYVVGTSQTSGFIRVTPQSLSLGSLIDQTPLELHVCVQRLDTSGGSDQFLAGISMISVF